MNRVRMLAAAAAVVALGAGASAAAAATTGALPAATHARHRPHIVARPDSVMVNTSTVLRGYGFAPRAKLRIWECSARNWVVPMKVCNHANAVRVQADHRGQFKVSFKVLVCPVSSHAIGDGFERTCFVGVPKIRGIDTEGLLGVAKITVTGP